MFAVRPRRLAVAALTASVAFGAWSPAFAGPAEDVADILKKTWEARGGTGIEIGKVEGTLARLTIASFKATMPVDGDEVVSTFGPTVMTGVEILPGGGLKVKSMESAASSVGGAGGDGKATFEKLTITDYEILPLEEQKKALAEKKNDQRFGSVVLSGMQITESEGKAPVKIGSITVAGSDWKGFTPRGGSFDMKALVVPIDPNDDGAKDMAAMGYKEVVVDVSGTGRWDEAKSEIDLSKLEIVGRDMGKVTLSFRLGGVTEELMQKLTALSNAEADKPADGPDPALEIMSQMEIVGASLRYDDASLAGKALDFQAKEAGVSRDAFVKNISAMLPMMLAELKNKAFEKKVTDAVGAFLKSPKSIALTAAPATPVPVAQIMGMAMLSPQNLPTVLSIDVTANK